MKFDLYAEYIMGDHQCGFQQNRSTTDNIFCILQILEKKWEYIRAVHQLCIDFNKACDSVRRQVLYDIFIEFGNPMKWVGLKKYVRLKPIAEFEYANICLSFNVLLFPLVHNFNILKTYEIV